MSAISQILRPSSLNHYVQKKVIEGYSYNMNDLIGTGYSSHVYKGKHDKTNKTIAIKVIEMKKVNNEVQKFLLKNEIAVLKKVTHKNCLKMLDVFQTSNNTYIITEFCNNGDLKNLIQKNKHIPEEQAVKIMKHILQGFKDLVQKQIIHRDIKPANIFLQDGVPKLADFGFAKDIHGSQCKVYYNVGSPLYMSPETLKNNTYSIKGDIWSLGILFYELLTGQTPWQANTEQELLRKMTNQPVTFPPHIKISQNAKDFIKGCLQFENSKRFSPEQMFDHVLVKLTSKTDKLQQENKENQRQPSPRDRDFLQKYDQKTTTALSTHQSHNASIKDPFKENNQNNQKNDSFTNYDKPTKKSITPHSQKTSITEKQTVSTRSNLFREKSSDPIRRKTFDVDEQIQKNQHFLQHERVRTQKSVENHGYRQNKQESQSLQHISAFDSLSNIPIEINHNKLPKKYQNLMKNIPSDPKLPSQVEQQLKPQKTESNKKNDKILISQINYCRFLFKLSTYVEKNDLFQSDILFKKLNYLICKNM